MQAIVLADGEVGSREALDAAWPGWLEPAALVIAADGGARHAASLDLPLAAWVGDGDSLGEAGIADLRAAGVPVRQVAAAKDESDTELAVRMAIERGATRIVVLGGLGGARLDHALANVGLLAAPGHPRHPDEPAPSTGAGVPRQRAAAGRERGAPPPARPDRWPGVPAAAG